jgi:hypothetical protein
MAIALLLRGGADPNPLAILGATVLIPLIIGLFGIRSPLLRRSGVVTYGRAARRGLLVEVITWSLGLAVFFPLTLYVDNRWLSTIPYPTSPYFGAMMSVMALLGAVVLFPLHLVLQRRGFTAWPAPPGGSGTTAEVRLPTLRDSWRLLLTTLVIMLAAIGFAGSVFGS